MARGKFKPGKLMPVGEYLMDTTISEEVEKLIAEADDEVRVNFRWGREQVALVKRAAALIGVPYQTYIKQAVYHQCLADLKSSVEALGAVDQSDTIRAEAVRRHKSTREQK